MKGTEGGRDAEVPGRDIRFSFSREYMELVAMEDLFRLCAARDVRLSSSGFMSGGIIWMRRNMTPSQREMPREMTCRPPAAMRV
jgi:hypothetical protein